MSKKLKFQVTYNQSKIYLSDFVLSINSLNKQYNRFVGEDEKKNKYKLRINKVSEGSISIGFVEEYAAILSSVSPILLPMLQGYALFLYNTFNYLLNEEIWRLGEYNTKDDYKNYKGIVSPINVSRSSDVSTSGGINIVANNESKVIVNYHMGNKEGEKIEWVCDKEIKKLKDPKNFITKNKVNLAFFQTKDFNPSRRIKGNKGVVFNISQSPKDIIFENKNLEFKIIKNKSNPLNFIYVVDIKIYLKEYANYPCADKEIIRYEILALHNTVEKFNAWHQGGLQL